jgi:hypothetical protein
VEQVELEEMITQMEQLVLSLEEVVEVLIQHQEHSMVVLEQEVK